MKAARILNSGNRVSQFRHPANSERGTCPTAQSRHSTTRRIRGKLHPNACWSVIFTQRGVQFDPAPKWGGPHRQHIRLYHGCLLNDKKLILQNGIDLNHSRVNSDFGRGFYTTTVFYQAEQWAWTRFHKMKAQVRNFPVVLEFVLDRRELSDLRWMSFVLGSRENHDFWSLVQHCRQSTNAAIRDHRGPVPDPKDNTWWYDAVGGPVAAIWQQKFALHDADQISFHTNDGIRPLNEQIKHKKSNSHRVKAPSSGHRKA